MKVKEAYKKLEQEFLKFDDKSWKEFLEFSANFHQYSMNNLVLIFFQKPDATYIAGYRQWQKLNRQVRKGEHGLVIFAPLIQKDEEGKRTLRGFRTARVFDISQTEGEEIPKLAKGFEGDDMGLLEEYMKASPIPVEFDSCTGGADGFLSKDRIVIRPSNNGKMLSVLLHELAHYYHQNAKNCTKEEKEFVAESAACMTAAMNGIDTSEYAVSYIKSWGGDFKKIQTLKKDIENCTKKINNLRSDKNANKQQ